jgi:hypothetical protein
MKHFMVHIIFYGFPDNKTKGSERTRIPTPCGGGPHFLTLFDERNKIVIINKQFHYFPAVYFINTHGEKLGTAYVP